MSLITRCPACTTMFRVVPDQLRVSGGWVRCGHCQEVFDASANLQPPLAAQVPATEAPPAPDSAALPEKPQVREPFLDVNPRALELDHHTFAEPVLEHPSTAQPDPAPDVEPKLEEPDVQQERAQPLQQAASALRDGDVAMVPSFVARTPPKVPGLGSRVVWSAAALFLAIGLCVQLIVHERDRLAAYEPATLQVLRPLCDILGCNLAPVRQIESVAIDSSAFTRIRGDVYRLTVTYKNTAPIAVETPALELTLTDLQDQAVLRRVFLSTELGLRQSQLDAATETAIAIPLTLRNALGGEKISGYRLLAFYP